MDRHIELGFEKLKSSGLTLEDAKALGIEILTKGETQKSCKGFKPLAALKINYFDLEGNPIADWHNAKPFYRIRYLEKSNSAYDNMQGKKEVRYVQEPFTAPVAYYPRGFTDWVSLAADTSQPVIITEGELKSAKACKEGFHTIGLGGVYNWRSNKLGITWLSSLDLIDWRRRNVYICFDSDYKTNPMVCTALKDFAEELQYKGAYAYIVSLPVIPGFEKVGLDDFLTFQQPAANALFEDLLHEAEPLGLSAPLWDINKQYVYVREPGLIIDQKTFSKSNPSAFKEHLNAPMRYQERQLRSDGSVSYKQVPAAGVWLKWPLRNEVQKLTYQPGKESFVQDSGVTKFNIWPGWGVEPKEGSVEMFLQLIEHLFTGADDGAKEWFLKWCAYPLQHPGTKMFSSAVFHGIRHGTGKSLIGYTMGRIYGKNFTEISQMDLHSSFNEWAEGKQFVMGDDVTGSNKRADADFLKKLITQLELRVNPKFINSYVVPDCINYFFTANHPDSFFLEDDDRRFFIHEIQVGPLPEKFYFEYSKWLDSGGAEAIFYYLLNLDLTGFNPSAPAFKTAAKERMITNVQSDLGAWVRNMLATPDFVLAVGRKKIEKDLFTSKELLAIYDPEGRTGTTANGLGRELSRVGVKQILKGRPVRLKDGSQVRLYIIRNEEKWLTATQQDVLEHFDTIAEKEKNSNKKKY